MSAIAAMCTEGVVEYELTDSTVDTEKFFDFVRGQLLPNMQPFPGNQSVLVMDNCSVHHVQELKDLVTCAGIPSLS